MWAGNAWYFYAFPLMELMPTLSCHSPPEHPQAFAHRLMEEAELNSSNISNAWYTCEREESCRAGVDYAYDDGDGSSVKNWVTNMDLICAEEYEIGLFGSLYFVGFTLGFIFLVPAIDSFGRRPMSILTHAVSALGMLINVSVRR